MLQNLLSTLPWDLTVVSTLAAFFKNMYMQKEPFAVRGTRGESCEENNSSLHVSGAVLICELKSEGFFPTLA